MAEEREIGQSESTLHNEAAEIEKIQVETLIVVSKVKAFIRAQSQMNTSQCAIEALTQKVAKACLAGIEHAQAAGRKTVMGRDFE